MTTTDTSTAYTLFVPNKRSLPAVSVDAENQPGLHRFLTDYFYASHDGKQQFIPYAWAGLMLEELEGETFDGAALPCDEDAPCYDSIQDWLKDVTSNFGDDTILVCSPYQEVG